MTSGCIEWQGYRTKDGYGRRMVKGRLLLTHRVAYCEHHAIEIDSIKGLEVRHTCDNPPCINPLHLIIGTHQENMQDMVDRGRRASQSRQLNGNAKLTEEQVAEIRRIYVYGSREFGTVALSKKYGVTQPHISKITLGKEWK